MALARSIGGTDNSGASGEMLRLYSARAEEHLRKRWSPLHVRSRVAQVRELANEVQAAADEHRQTLESLEHQLIDRLWLPPSLAANTLAPLRERMRLLGELRARLQACETGFAALPVDEALSDVPAPMVIRLSA
jgi:hypothetical protein